MPPLVVLLEVYMSTFKKKTTTIQFEIPNNINEFIGRFLKSYGFKNVTVSYYLKACAINHLIFKNVLNELGEPNECVIIPTLDFDSIPMPELREVCSVSEKK